MIDVGDTIVAIATPPGRGALGVVRASGTQVTTIARALLGQVPRPRHATFCRFLDADGDIIDEGIAILFKAPASFTGEDMLELYAHGSPVVLDRLVECIATQGVRLAGPGEFSRRAFLNGKYDLAQLEAIADLITSADRIGARCAQRSLQGEFSKQTLLLCDDLAKLRAHIEASVDFSDEDLDFAQKDELVKTLKDLSKRIDQLQLRAQRGARLHAGGEIVIVGQPNVGKSSLLNRFAGREEAIVSEIAGTTRDVIKSDLLIGHLPVRASDTAGLRQSGDEIEQEGVYRARGACRHTDLVLLVMDARVGMGEIEKELFTEWMAEGIEWIEIYNKQDLVVGGTNDKLWRVSAKTGEGIDALATHIARQLGGGNADDAKDAIVARRRHLVALANAGHAMTQAAEHLNAGAIELLAEEIRIAEQALVEITGAKTTESLLGDIFSQFCVGK